MAKSKDKNYVSPYEGRDFSGYTDEDYAREFDARRAGQQAYQNTVVNGQDNGSALKPGGDTVNNSVLGTFKDSIDKALYDVVGGVARFGANQIDPGARDGILNGIADWAEERSAYNTEDPQQLTGAKWWANAVGNAIGSSAPTAIIFAAMSALGPAAGGLSALAGGVANGARLANLISKGKTLGTFAQAAKAGANLVSKGAGAVASGDRALREAALIRKFWTSPFGKFAIADQLGNIPESMSEAGNLITQLRQDPENYTDEEIATAAWKSFGGNMAWLTATDALQAHVLGKMLGKPVQEATTETFGKMLSQKGIEFSKEGLKQLGKQTAKVSAANAFQEGLEEFGQGYIENKAAGQDFNVEEAIEAAKMGAAGGMFLGAGGNVLNARMDNSKKIRLNGRLYEISNPDSEGRVHTKIDGQEVSHSEFFNKVGGMVEGGLTARNFGDNGFVDPRDIKTVRDVDNYIADMNERMNYYGGLGTFENAGIISDYIRQAENVTGDSKVAIGRKLVEATNNSIRDVIVRHKAKVQAENQAKVQEDIAKNAQTQREEVVAAEQKNTASTVSNLETAQNINDTNTKILFGPGAVGAAATTAQVQNATDAANKILSDVANSNKRVQNNTSNNVRVAMDKTGKSVFGLVQGINSHPQDFKSIDELDNVLESGRNIFDPQDLNGKEQYDRTTFTNTDGMIDAYSHGAQRSWEHNAKAAKTQEELDTAKKKFDERMSRLEKAGADKLDGKKHLAQKKAAQEMYAQLSEGIKNPDTSLIRDAVDKMVAASKKGLKNLKQSKANLLRSKKNQSPAVQKAINDKFTELEKELTKNETKDNKPIQGSDTLSKQAEPKEDGDKGASKENKGSDNTEGKVKRDENTPRKMVGDNIRVALDVAKYHTDDVLKGLKSHKRDIKVNENVKVDKGGNEVSTNIKETADVKTIDSLVSEFQKVYKEYDNMPAEKLSDAAREKTLKHLWDLVSKMGDTNDKIRYAAKAAEISRRWQTAKQSVERIAEAVENLRNAKGSIDGLRKEISKVLGEDITDGTTNLTNEEKDNIIASWKEKVKAVGIDMCSTPEEFLAKKADIIEDTKDSKLYKVTDIENSNGRIYIHYEENGVAKQDEITQDMGWTLPGSKVIYINKNTMDASTPIHEYVHVWAYVIKQNNPELWNKIKDVMKRTGMYDLVQEVGQYGKLSEDVVVEEALAFTTGYHWATIEKAINDKEKSSLWLRAVKGFWNAVKELLGFSTNRKNAVDNDVFDLMQMPIASLLNKDTGVGISEREAMQQTADIAARLSFGEIKADEAYESVEKIKENMVKAGLADPALITKLQKKMYAQLQTAQILAQEADDITESYIEPVIDALVKAESILATNTSTTLEKFVPEKIYANNKKKSIGLKRADKVGWYSANNAFADLFKDGILNRKKLATYRGDVFDNVQNSPYFNKLWGILASRAIDKFEAALNNHKQGEEFKKSSATHAKTDILNRMQLIKTQAKRTFDKGYMPPRNNSVVQKKASGSYVMPSSVIREKVGAEDFNKLFAEDITQEEFNKIFDKVEDKGDKPKLMSARKQGSLATSKEHFGGVDVAADTLLQVEDEYGDGNLDVADLMNSKMTVKGSKFIEHTVRVPNLSTTYKISNAMRLYSRAIYRGATFIAQNPTATQEMVKEYIESDNFEYGDSVMEVALSLRNLPTISNLDNARLQDFALFLGNVIAKCEKHFSGVEMYLGDVEPTVREYLFGNAGTVSRSLLDYFGADSYEVYDTGFQPLHGDNKIIAFSKGGIGSEVKYSYLEKQTQDRFGNSYYYNVLENPRFGELANQSYNGYSLKQAIAPAWNGLSEEDKIQMLDDTVKAVANVLVFNDLNVDSRMFEKENFDLFAKKDTGAIDKLPKRIEECVKYITGNKTVNHTNVKVDNGNLVHPLWTEIENNKAKSDNEKVEEVQKHKIKLLQDMQRLVNDDELKQLVNRLEPVLRDFLSLKNKDDRELVLEKLNKTEVKLFEVMSLRISGLIDALKRAKLLSEDNKKIKSGWGQSVDEVAQDFDIQLDDMIKTSLQKDGYIEGLVNALNDLREGNFAAADIDWNNEVYDRQEQDAADQDLQDTNDELRRIQEEDDAEEATYYEDDVEAQDDTEVEEEGTRSKSFRNDELEPEQSDKEAVEKTVEKAEKASPFEDNKNTSLIKSILDLEVAFMYRLTLTDKTPRLDAAKMIRGLLMKKTNEYIQTWSNAQEAGKLIQAEAANFEKAKAEIEKNISSQISVVMRNAPNRREFRPSWFARLLAGRATGYTVDGTHVVFRGPQLRNDEVKTIDDRVKSVLEDVGVRVIQDNLSEKLAKTNIDNTVKKWADSLGDAEAITKAKALADVSENHKANRTSLINAIVQAQDNIMEFATHNERCYTKVYKNQDDSYSTEWREVEPQLYSLAKYVYEKKTGKKVKVQERFLKDNAVTKIALTYGCSEEVAKLAYNIALNEHLPRPYRLTIKGVDKETLLQANNIADSIYNNMPRNYAEQNRSFEELRSLANNNLEAMAATLLMNRMKRAETTANFAIKSVRARLNAIENKLVHAQIEHDAFTTWALYLNDLRTDNTGTQESVVNIQKAVDNLRSKYKEDENAFTALTEEIFGINIRNILAEQLGIYNQGEGPVSSNRDARHNNQAVDEQRYVSTVMRERLAGSISVPGRRTVDGRAQGSNQAGISGQSNIQPSTRLEPARGVEARSTNLVGGKTDYRWRKRNVNGSVEGGKGNEGQGTRIRPLEGSTNNRREGVGGPQANRNLYAQVSREEGLEGTSHILSVLDYINGLYVADDKKRSRDNKNANDEYFSARKILVVTSSPEESQRWSQLAQQRYGNAINEYGNDFDGVGVATITFDALSKENGGNEKWDNVVVADPNFINNAEYYDKVSRLVGYIQDDGLDTYAELSRYVAEQGDKILTTAMGKDYLNTMVELERYLKTVEDRVKSDKTVLDDVTYDNEVGQKLRQTLQNINKVEVSDKARKTIHGLFISHYLAKVKEGRKNAWNISNALHTERIFVSMAEPMKETGEINNTVATPNGFRGEFSYLSNMHPSPITIDGKTYNSVENYFQAMKSTDTNTQQKIATASPVNARKFGRQIELREDWDNIKDDVMENAVKAKFQQHPELMSKLNTVQGEIVEYNDWGDRYWGKDKVTQIGDNKLGKILMSIRGDNRTVVDSLKQTKWENVNDISAGHIQTTNAMTLKNNPKSFENKVVVDITRGKGPTRAYPKAVDGSKYAPSQKVLDDWKNSKQDQAAIDAYIGSYVAEQNAAYEQDNTHYDLINKQDKDVVLACYERVNEFCHRHILKALAEAANNNNGEKVVSFEGVDTSGVSVQQAWEDLQKRNAAMKKVVNNPANYYEKLPYEIPYHTPAFVKGMDEVVNLYTKMRKAQKALDDNTDKRAQQEKQEALATLQNKLVDLLNSVDKAERSLMLDRLANSLGVEADKNVPRRMSTVSVKAKINGSNTSFDLVPNNAKKTIENLRELIKANPNETVELDLTGVTTKEAADKWQVILDLASTPKRMSTAIDGRIRAQHSSIHDFDRFDTENHFFNGEGAMVHGSGTYVTLNTTGASKYAQRFISTRAITEYDVKLKYETLNPINIVFGNKSDVQERENILEKYGITTVPGFLKGIDIETEIESFANSLRVFFNKIDNPIAYGKTVNFFQKPENIDLFTDLYIALKVSNIWESIERVPDADYLDDLISSAKASAQDLINVYGFNVDLNKVNTVLDSLKSQIRVTSAVVGRLYDVLIPSPNELLDLRVDFDKQSKKHKDALRDIARRALQTELGQYIFNENGELNQKALEEARLSITDIGRSFLSHDDISAIDFWAADVSNYWNVNERWFQLMPLRYNKPELGTLADLKIEFYKNLVEEWLRDTAYAEGYENTVIDSERWDEEDWDDDTENISKKNSAALTAINKYIMGNKTINFTQNQIETAFKNIVPLQGDMWSLRKRLIVLYDHNEFELIEELKLRGIKGHLYYGYEDKNCAVIFDSNDVEIQNKYESFDEYQEAMDLAGINIPRRMSFGKSLDDIGDRAKKFVQHPVDTFNEWAVGKPDNGKDVTFLENELDDARYKYERAVRGIANEHDRQFITIIKTETDPETGRKIKVAEKEIERPEYTALKKAEEAHLKALSERMPSFSFFRSVHNLAKENPFINKLYTIFTGAGTKQEQLRNRFANKWNEILDLLETQEQIDSFSNILFMGSVEGKYYTRTELLEDDVDSNVIEAVQRVRAMNDSLYMLQNRAFRGLIPGKNMFVRVRMGVYGYDQKRNEPAVYDYIQGQNGADVDRRMNKSVLQTIVEDKFNEDVFITLFKAADNTYYKTKDEAVAHNQQNGMDSETAKANVVTEDLSPRDFLGHNHIVQNMENGNLTVTLWKKNENGSVSSLIGTELQLSPSEDVLISYNKPQVHHGHSESMIVGSEEWEKFKSDPHNYIYGTHDENGNIIESDLRIIYRDNMFNPQTGEYGLTPVYSIVYDYVKPNFPYRKGYLPHFFGGYGVYGIISEPRPDGSFRERIAILASDDDVQVAIQKAEEIKKNGITFVDKKFDENGVDRSVTRFLAPNGKIGNKKKQDGQEGIIEVFVKPKDFDMQSDKNLDECNLDEWEFKKTVDAAAQISGGDFNALQERLKPILQSKKLHHRFNSHEYKQTGAWGWNLNVFDIMPKYINQATRYAAMEPAKFEAISEFEKMFGEGSFEKEAPVSAPLRRWAKRYIQYNNGTPMELERKLNQFIADNEWLSKFFAKHCNANYRDRIPLLIGTKINSIVAPAMLGCFSISSALVNMTQLKNAYVKIGYKGLEKGFAAVKYMKTQQLKISNLEKSIKDKRKEYSKLMREYNNLQHAILQYQGGLMSSASFSKYKEWQNRLPTIQKELDRVKKSIQPTLNEISKLKSDKQYLDYLRILHETGTDTRIGLSSPSTFTKGWTAKKKLQNKQLDWDAVRYYLRKASDKGMVFFQGTEEMTRSIATLGAYLQARETPEIMGRPDFIRKSAVDFARSVDIFANFDYGAADAPGLFSLFSGTGFGEVATLFQKYPIKESEIMMQALPMFGSKTMTTSEKIRYWSTYMMLCGMFAFPLFDWLEDLINEISGVRVFSRAKARILETFGENPFTYAICYGIPGAFGTDISRRVSLANMTPDHDSLWGYITGVPGSAALNIANSLVNGDGIGAIKSYTPALGHAMEAYYGARYNRKGRMAYRYNNTERAWKFFGFRPTGESVQRDVQAEERNQTNRKQIERQSLKTYLAKKFSAGDQITESDRQEMRNLKLKWKDVVEEYKKQLHTKMELKKKIM